jgi:hypothetical protein
MFGIDRPFDSQCKSTHDVLFASRHCSSILIAHLHSAWFRPSLYVRDWQPLILAIMEMVRVLAVVTDISLL